ncbi:hypothetical protein BDQ17DRAFT_1438578 [Cyathus striatus]|nr:hypothetical protein BDQ17DRAFT_1438578 [Cyathus striatus]
MPAPTTLLSPMLSILLQDLVRPVHVNDTPSSSLPLPALTPVLAQDLETGDTARRKTLRAAITKRSGAAQALPDNFDNSNEWGTEKILSNTTLHPMTNGISSPFSTPTSLVHKEQL